MQNQEWLQNCSLSFRSPISSNHLLWRSKEVSFLYNMAAFLSTPDEHYLSYSWLINYHTPGHSNGTQCLCLCFYMEQGDRQGGHLSHKYLVCPLSHSLSSGVSNGLNVQISWVYRMCKFTLIYPTSNGILVLNKN